MEESKTIRDLFNNYMSDKIKKPINYSFLSGTIDTILDEFNKKLVKHKDKKKLEKLCDTFLEMNSIDCEESFVKGFSYAVQLMTESFSQKIH